MRKNRKISIVALLAIAVIISSTPILLVSQSKAATQISNPVFSIMQISDTQFLAAFYPQLFSDTTKWIVDNYAAYNTKMVVHTGDIVDNINGTGGTLSDPVQWSNANAAMASLVNAEIPYCWDAGNHDQIPWNNASAGWLGSNYPAFNAILMRSKNYWVSDFLDSKNTAVRFSNMGYDFLIINLEYMANNAALNWMKNLLDTNKNSNVIIAAHTYLNKAAGYGFSSAGLPGEVAWCTNLKTIIDGYPNIFLTLSGHDPTGTANMTRVGNREEVFFDRQGINTQTGAAAVRIYTLDLSSKQVNVSTFAYNNTAKNWGWLTDSYNKFSFVATLKSNDWSQVTSARPLKAYPALLETEWQKNATTSPNGQYDKIALHRLVNPSLRTQGVILMTNCPTWGTGEQRISNPSTDNWTKYENFSQAIYLANRGFDVYAIDYRTHFIPKNLPANQTGFMANWGWDVWVSDIKEAADKVKEVSGASKFFISGECSGAEAALNFATRYQSDLRGIILLDPNFLGVNPPHPIVSTPKTTNTFNLTTVLASMDKAQNWTRVDWPQYMKDWASYALQNPGAPAVGPNGTAPLLQINPTTNKTWTNVNEYFGYALHSNWGASIAPGLYSNVLGGYGNLAQDEYALVNSEYVPLRLLYENMAMADWTNCPFVNFDYNDRYKDISVPVLVFAASIFANRAGPFRFVNDMATSDFTGVMLPNYGHMDVYMGTNSARDVSQPMLDWMTSRYQQPAASTFSSVTVFAGQTWYFCVHSNGGTSPHKYQWYEGTTVLAGQTSMVLAASKSSPGTYTYYCKVTDADGTTIDSTPVTLTVK